MLLPEPIVVASDWSPGSAWTSYVTPASTWKTTPVSIGWAGAPPAPLLDAEAVAILDVASRAWAVPPCSAARFSILPSTGPVSDLSANGRNDVVVHLTDWPSPLATGAAAHTVIFVAGDRITEADIHLNARDFTFDSKGLDLRSVLTHELGHVIGIGHSADARATMSAGLPAGIAARSLESDDVAAVCALYPSSDTSPHGCESGCPTGFACIGYGCERGEPGTVGEACADTPRRCEGAGDTARCIPTSVGDRCATLCATTTCGTGLSCADFEDDRRCIRDGTSIPTVDAGPPPPDAPNSGPSAASGEGGGCSLARGEGSANSLVLFVAISIASLRRRAR